MILTICNRTYLDDGEDDPSFTDEVVRNEIHFKKLPLSFWDPIYITYEKTLDRRLYRRYPPHNHVLDNRLYLDILYDALQSPRAVMLNFCVFFMLRNVKLFFGWVTVVTPTLKTTNRD